MVSYMEFAIPTASGPLNLTLTTGAPTFILGRNGTGKSALVHYVRNHLPHDQRDKFVYLPGSRVTYFDNDSLAMNPAERFNHSQNRVAWDQQPSIRYRPIQGTQRNDRTIFELDLAISQYQSDVFEDVKKHGIASAAIPRAQSNSSPLDIVNQLLLAANLPFEIVRNKGELKAKRSDAIYSLSRLSDGERVALLLIAEVVAAEKGSFFLIDEPELHLHRAIILPLTTAVLALRPDCYFLVSTHELALPGEHDDAAIVLVRGSTWDGDQATLWEVDLLRNPSEIPEELRIDLLGSRRKILFIEGTETSRDLPLYTLLFDKVSIRHRSSCVDVQKAVSGLRSVEATHHAEVFGLVDNDSMDGEYKEKLEADFVFALPIFSVESFYYCADVLDAVAERQAGTFGASAADLLSQARDHALAILAREDVARRLAGRVAERHFRDLFLKKIPDRDAIVAGTGIDVSIPSPFNQIHDRLRDLVANQDLETIIAGFPVREAGILTPIAKALHFTKDTDFEQAARVAIASDSALADRLRQKLGKLSDLLSA